MQVYKYKGLKKFRIIVNKIYEEKQIYEMDMKD